MNPGSQAEEHLQKNSEIFGSLTVPGDGGWSLGHTGRQGQWRASSNVSQNPLGITPREQGWMHLVGSLRKAVIQPGI